MELLFVSSMTGLGALVEWNGYLWHSVNYNLSISVHDFLYQTTVIIQLQGKQWEMTTKTHWNTLKFKGLYQVIMRHSQYNTEDPILSVKTNISDKLIGITGDETLPYAQVRFDTWFFSTQRRKYELWSEWESRHFHHHEAGSYFLYSELHLLHLLKVKSMK